MSYNSPCRFKNPEEKRKIFNDYSGIRAIAELWADPLSKNKGAECEAYIKVAVEKDRLKAQNFLRVKFVNQGWGVNLTICPAKETPLYAAEYSHMKFKIRSPEEENVGVRVRIVDADYVFWGFGISDYEHKNLSTSNHNWKDINISLRDSNWFEFKFDGYPKKEDQNKPNFSAIQLITFEVGIESKNPKLIPSMTKFKPNKKEALIDISEIRFI